MDVAFVNIQDNIAVPVLSIYFFLTFFEIISDIHNSYKNNGVNSYVPFPQLLPVLTSSISNYDTVAKLRHQHQYDTVN